MPDTLRCTCLHAAKIHTRSVVALAQAGGAGEPQRPALRGGPGRQAGSGV